MGEVYSTYGDDSSILFLINATEYTDLSEHLKALCETMHDALNSFLRVDIVFSIGICSQTDRIPTMPTSQRGNSCPPCCLWKNSLRMQWY